MLSEGQAHECLFSCIGGGETGMDCWIVEYVLIRWSL